MDLSSPGSQTMTVLTKPQLSYLGVMTTRKDDMVRSLVIITYAWSPGNTFSIYKIVSFSGKVSVSVNTRVIH